MTTLPSILAVPLAGPSKHREVPLTDGDTIGRGSECALRLPHASVSRLHARVERRAGAWFLVDQDSRNGLHTRGGAVAELQLDRPQAVRFGDYPVRFQAGSSAAAGAPAESLDSPLDEELEFAVELEGLGDRLELEDADGLSLEDPAEIELAHTAARPTARVTDSARSEAAAGRRSARATQPASSQSAAPETTLQRRAALVAEAERASGGLLRGDFTQQPAWLQGLLWLAAAGLTGGLAYFAFELVRQSRA